MKLKWPFTRQNKNGSTDVSSDVEDYYAAEHRERVGVAWLLALGTLIVTVAVVIGLYYAGRWAYHEITGDNNSGSNQTTKNGNSSGTPNSKSPGKNPTHPEQADNNGSSQQTGSSSGQNSSGASSQPSQPGNKQLTDTGPGDVIAIFASTSAGAAVAYQTVVRSRLRKATIKKTAR